MRGMPMVEDTIGIVSGRPKTIYLNPDVLERRDLLFSLVDSGLSQ